MDIEVLAGGNVSDVSALTEDSKHPKQIYFLPTVNHRSLHHRSEVSGELSTDVTAGGGDDAGDDDDDEPIDALTVCASWQVR